MSVIVKNQDEFDATLRALVPINGLPVEYRDQVLAQAAILEVAKGQYVFHEGDRDTFAYYLLDGELRLSARGQHVRTVVGGTEDAVHPLAQLQPRQLSALVVKNATVLRVDRNLLNRLLALTGAIGEQVTVEVIDADTSEDADWMTRMLQSELFSRVPAANIQRIFTQMESVAAKAGDEVVRQGGPGDYYYVVQSGRCEVVRSAARGQQRVRLAELGPGDSFGEEALVANSHRNASVVMLTDGELRRLTKEDFIELIKKPLLSEVNYDRASALAESGAVWLDVRFPDEFRRSALPGAINIPLNVLRQLTDKLADDRGYIACCDSGTRSAVAAFLLAERGFEVYFLCGGFAAYGLLTEFPQRGSTAIHLGSGLVAAPDLDRRMTAEVVPFPPDTQPYRDGVATAAAVRTEVEAQILDRAAQPVSAATNDTTLEADVRAEALKAELARATLQLEEARRLKEEAEAAQSAAEAAAEQRIERERQRLLAEAKRTAAERQQLTEHANQALQEGQARLAEATKHAEQAAKAAEAAAAERIKAAQEQAAEESRRIEQERLAAEAAARAAIEAARQRLADEAARIEAQRAAAEQALEEQRRAERAQLDQESERARRTWEEAQKLKADLEQARLQAEQEARQRHEDHEARIQRMQQEADVRLREEERRLEQTYAWQAEELAKLQKLKEDAERRLEQERDRVAVESDHASQRLAEARRIQREVEATKDAATKEAEQRHQRQLELERRMRSEVKARIKEERHRLEAEFARNAEELERAKRERDAAEVARAAAAAEAEKIIQEYKESHDQLRRQEEQNLEAERQRLESEARQLKEALAEAQQVKQEAMLAQQQVEQELADLKRQRSNSITRASQAGHELAAAIATAEQDVARARAEVFAAERAQQVATAAQLANRDSMERNQDAVVAAKECMELEVVEWLKEQEQNEGSPMRREILANQQQHLERIKRRAQQARDQSKLHDQTLIDDLEQLLRNN